MEKSAGTTSEKVSNHIPNDLAFSILSKLPLKSLKRFGCVHKSWALLFENPHFMSIFRSNFISNHRSYYDDTSLLLQQSGRVFHSLSGERFENRVKLDLPIPFEQDNPIFYIMDSNSITGILCLCQSDGQGDGKVVLWNPATEEFKIIPPSPAVESVPLLYWDVWVTFHGFGYDHVRDDYKVIRYVRFDKRTDIDYVVPWEYSFYNDFWEIYSLRSNSWRKLDVNMPRRIGNSVGQQVYMDGMCHWWGVIGGEIIETHNVEGAPYRVSSFDFSNEVFFITHIPLDIISDKDDSFDLNWMFLHLVVLNGSIAVIPFNYSSTTTFHISILGKLGVKESWTKLFTVGPLPCIEHPIGVGKKGDIFFRRKDGELVWFDLSSQMIKELGFKVDSYFCHIVIYKESLLPIGGINN